MISDEDDNVGDNDGYGDNDSDVDVDADGDGDINTKDQPTFSSAPHMFLGMQVPPTGPLLPPPTKAAS